MDAKDIVSRGQTGKQLTFSEKKLIESEVSFDLVSLKRRLDSPLSLMRI